MIPVFSIPPAPDHEQLRQHMEVAIQKLVNSLHLGDHVFVSPINAKGNTISNLPLPSNPKDVATKEYVDATIASQDKAHWNVINRRFRPYLNAPGGGGTNVTTVVAGAGVTVTGSTTATVATVYGTHGTSTVIQMYGAGTSTNSHMAIFDANGNVIDGGLPTAAINFADNETPSGTLNGTNTTYTLAHTPNPAASVKLFVNGILQRQGTAGDYTLSTNTISYITSVLTSNDWHLAWYRF